MSTRVDSPLLGRMDILNATRPRSVRRALFGPVDHEQVKSDLQRLKAEQCKVDQEKWNFNFTEEKPLPGAYKWVPINHQDNSDDEDNVVITTHVRLQHSPVSESREDDQEHYITTVKDGASENSQETPQSTCRKSTVPTSIDITAKSTQPKINEIFRSKKRKCCDEITASSSPKQQKLKHTSSTSQTAPSSPDSTAV